MADQYTSEADRVERFEEGAWQESQIARPASHDDGHRRDPEEAHTSVQMEALDPNWVSKINERHPIKPTGLEVSWTSMSCSIHRVPVKFRVRNPTAYDPHVVSIGPFHYEKRHGQLKAVEALKRRYLHDILLRNGRGSLEQYFYTIKQLEESARKCYSEVIELDGYSFVEMMVLDGCFIIELFRRYAFSEHIDDPIFKLKWLKAAVKADLLMLENQIPFLILQRLFELTMTNVPSPFTSLAQWALSFFHSERNGMRTTERINNSMRTTERIKNSNVQIQHLLHLYHTNYVVRTKKRQSLPPAPSESKLLIPSASKLKERGIKFRTSHVQYASYLDIRFDIGKGVLEIPQLEVSDNTNIKFYNLVSFEQCYYHCKKYFTAYATFMDYLINNSKDVEILCRKEIIHNWLGSDDYLATFFNNLGREVVVYDQHFYLADICIEINRYCARAWPKFRQSLVHDYLKNPWAIISVLGALFLLFLTLTQTFFTSFPKFAFGK